MPLTPIAVILAGVWLIIDSHSNPSSTLTLVFGILIVALVLVDVLRPYYHRAPVSR